MLRSSEWIKWLKSKTRCLWIHGIPGAGKTVLASNLISAINQHCKDHPSKKHAFVYYYCYFGHNQDEAAPFLRWIINQLCRQADIVPTLVFTLYKKGSHPNLADLFCALQAILQSFETVYITVDAIDESMPREDLLKVLRDLVTDPRFQNVQLLGTSREYIDIENVMTPISVRVSMMNPLLDEDIRKYVRSRVDTNLKMMRWTSDLRDEVVDAVSSKAKGM